MKTYTWPNGIVVRENMTEFLEKFKQKPASLARIVKKHASIIQAKAVIDAPVDTGALKNSIIAEPIDENNYIIRDGVTYGIFTELGNRNYPAKHYLGGACEREAEPFFRDVRDELTK